MNIYTTFPIEMYLRYDTRGSYPKQYVLSSNNLMLYTLCTARYHTKTPVKKRYRAKTNNFSPILPYPLRTQKVAISTIHIPVLGYVYTL